MENYCSKLSRGQPRVCPNCKKKLPVQLQRLFTGTRDSPAELSKEERESYLLALFATHAFVGEGALDAAAAVGRIEEWLDRNRIVHITNINFGVGSLDFWALVAHPS